MFLGSIVVDRSMPPSDAVAAENASRRWACSCAIAEDGASMACSGRKVLEAADLQVLVRHLRVAAPRVALEVRAQTNDVVEPERRDV